MSKQKAKGTSFESLIVGYLKEHGWPDAERRALTGTHDKGDITGVPSLVFECKNHKTLSLSGWLIETETERQNADAQYGVLVAKRKGYGQAADQYAVLRLEDMIRLLHAAGYGKELE